MSLSLLLSESVSKDLNLGLISLVSVNTEHIQAYTTFVLIRVKYRNTVGLIIDKNNNCQRIVFFSEKKNLQKCKKILQKP